MLEESLFVAYIDDLRRERKNALKEVMRALMAFTDDDPSDKAAYHELFERELMVGPRKNKRKRANMAVDLEQDEFGDYLDWGDDDFDSGDEDDEGENPQRSSSPTPIRLKAGARSRKKPGQSTKREPVSSFRASDGTADSVSLRLRLFRLLSAAANYLPDRFCAVDELYETFADRIRSLPLPMFRLFVESHSTTLPAFAHVSLLRHLAEELLPSSSSRPDPGDVDPVTDAEHGLSVIMAEQCFLPFAAGRVTAEDNAKLSLVLENMLWFIYANRDIECDEGLARAVERGIKAREDKIKRKGAAAQLACRGAPGPDSAAREALDRSARSLRLFVRIAGV